MKIRKSLFTSHFSLPDSEGQTIIEFVLIFFISLVLIFGVMDIARLSWTMFHLHGAAFAAARASAVGKSPLIAANWITKRTLGSACSATAPKSARIPSKNPAITLNPLAAANLEIHAINARITYIYRPLFAAGAFKTGVIPITVTSRMESEIPNPMPRSR